MGVFTQNSVADVCEQLFSKALIDKFQYMANVGFGASLSGEELINECHNAIYTRIIAHVNFIRYAEIQTVELKPKERKRLIGCKYANNSLVNVTILNSTWFTNLVKSDSFSVRGHFRLQPFGVGMQNRKLIWINEFQKEGYTAPARKIAKHRTKIEEEGS